MRSKTVGTSFEFEYSNSNPEGIKFECFEFKYPCAMKFCQPENQFRLAIPFTHNSNNLTYNKPDHYNNNERNCNYTP